MGSIDVLAIVFQLIGGLGLFLTGMQFMSDGLQKSSGDSLKKILEKLTSNRIIGTGVGAAVTAVIQSSSAATVMVVGFVNAGLMSLTQALSVILGANIGTTITGQIIAFKITAISLPCVGAGAILYIFVKKPAVQYLGQILLGLGMLFLGMDIMTKAFMPVSASEEIKSVFVFFSENHTLAVLAGAITTLIVQSSSATMGITIALATTGLIDFSGAAALVLGENIGTTITANLAALNASRSAKQAALGHFLFNFIGVAYMMALLNPFMEFINLVTPGDAAYMAADGTFPYIGRHIANLHTMFNIINTAVFLPFLPLLAKLCEKIIKPAQEKDDGSLHLSDALISTPEIAAGLAQKEAVRMLNTSIAIFNRARDLIVNNDEKSSKESKKLSAVLENFNEEIHSFLIKLSSCSLSARSQRNIHNISAAVEEINQMGERGLKIIKTYSKMRDKNIVLSDTAKSELNDILSKVDSFIKNIGSLYMNKENTKDFAALAQKEDEIDGIRKQYKKNHMKRLDDGLCSLAAGLSFIELLNTLEKIADNMYNIAQIIMDENT